jgi:positive regulator of sigma E activity
MATNLYTNPSTQVTTYTQPTATPTAKVKAVGYAGGVVTSVAALVYLLSLFGIIVPVDVSDAAVQLITGVIALVSLVQTIVTFAAGYFKKSDTANGAQK